MGIGKEIGEDRSTGNGRNRMEAEENRDEKGIRIGQGME